MADLSDSIPETEIPRQIVEAEIEMLIDLLDRLDANPDLEDGTDIENDTADNEPLHGAPEQQAGSWGGIDASVGLGDGEELELGWTELEARFGRHSAAGNDMYEPSLGSNGGINQLKWSKGPTDDREDEHDGREDCCEDEGAQCDDEGALEEDNGTAEDDFPSETYMSREHSAATQAEINRLLAFVKPRELGPVVYSSQGLRGIVSRIY